MKKLFYFSFLVYSIVSTFCINDVEGQSDKDIELLIIDKCGNDTNSSEIMRSIQESSRCSRQALTDLFFVNYFTSDEKVFSELFSNNCADFQNSTLNCINTNLLVYTECLSDEDKHYTQILNNIISNILEYLCTDNGQLMESVYANNGMKCFMDVGDALNICGHHIPNNNKFKLVPSDFIKELNCSNLSDIRTCILPLYDNCDVKIHNFLNGIFKAFMDPFSCVIQQESTTNSQTINEI